MRQGNMRENCWTQDSGEPLQQGCQTESPEGHSVCRFLWFPFNQLSIKACIPRCVASLANQWLERTKGAENNQKTSRHSGPPGLEFDTCALQNPPSGSLRRNWGRRRDRKLEMGARPETGPGIKMGSGSLKRDQGRKHRTGFSDGTGSLRLGLGCWDRAHEPEKGIGLEKKPRPEKGMGLETGVGPEKGIGLETGVGPEKG